VLGIKNAVIEGSVLGRRYNVPEQLSDSEERLLAAYTVKEGIRDPHTILDHAWALGQTEAWHDTLFRIGVTDTLHQAPLVIKLFDEAQSLASA